MRSLGTRPDELIDAPHPTGRSCRRVSQSAAGMMSGKSRLEQMNAGRLSHADQPSSRRCSREHGPRLTALAAAGPQV